MIQAGYVVDKHDALCLYKIHKDGYFSAGITLAGFGTKPIPDEICDNAILRGVNYAGLLIRKVIDILFDKECQDLELAAYYLSQQLEKLNGSLAYLSRNMGQGIYIAGVVSYVVGDQFICLPFGGAYACICDDNGIYPLRNQALPADNDPKYIWDALGGSNPWNAKFAKGRLPLNSQLVCVTQMPPTSLLTSVFASPTHNDPKYVAAAIHSGLNSWDTPKAVLVLQQEADLLNNKEEATVL